MEQKSRYGGFAPVNYEATGFFRLEGAGRKWRMVDPEGHPFFIIGINHIDAAALKYKENLHIWHERYGSRGRWIYDGVVKPLKSWGFNTIAWTKEWVTPEFRHSPEWTPEEFRQAQMAYIPHLDFLSIETWNRQAYYPDVFSKEFEEWCDYQARYWCTVLADDPYLLGYAYTARPAWVKHKHTTSWVDQLDLDLKKPGDRARLREIIRKYYQTAYAAIRRYDKNHLIFGDLIEGFDGEPIVPDEHPPIEVFEEMQPYVDVLSINWYDRFEILAETVSDWQHKTGKPVFLADSGFTAPTELIPDVWEKIYVETQQARGEAYRRFLQQAAIAGYIIGWGWCAYIENRVRRWGLRTQWDEPYQECTNIMTDFNAKLYHQLWPDLIAEESN